MHNESVHLDEEIDALRTPQASSPFDNLLQQAMEWLQLVPPPDPSLSTASSTAVPFTTASVASTTISTTITTAAVASAAIRKYRCRRGGRAG